jgi:CPA1 family monovalent cation:H+ antiporter
LASADLTKALIVIGAVSAVLIAVRLAFLYAAVYLIRLIDRRPQQRQRRVSNRSRVVSGLVGFRRAVSLAVALSVPATLNSGGHSPAGT